MSRRILTMAFAGLLFLVGAGAVAAQTTIHLLPGATPAASGTNLQNALAGVVGTAAKPFVLKLDPGIYDVGSLPVTMKPWVDIEGSGQTITTLRGVGNDVGFLTAVVLGASNAELRDLRVQSLGRTFTNSIAVLLNNVTNAGLRDVTLLSSGASGGNWGLRNLASTSLLQDLRIDVSGAGEVYGIACTGASGGISRPAIRRAVINVSGTSHPHGIYADQNAAPSVRDVEIQVSGGTTGYGLRYAYGADLTAANLEVTNARIVVSGSSAQGYGIEITGNGNTFAITHSNLSAFVPGMGFGIHYGGSASSPVVFVDHCDVGGKTNSLALPLAPARVGASRLTGVANIAAPACAASFNGNYVALGSLCL